jgi:beta-glucanase (GH16 family)
VPLCPDARRRIITALLLAPLLPAALVGCGDPAPRADISPANLEPLEPISVAAAPRSPRALTIDGPATVGAAPAHRLRPTSASAARTGTRPTLVWADEFSGALDLTTPDRHGRWRANDVWQDVSRGYRDFAGTSWNLNPNETPAHTPFSVRNGVLTITMTRTPAELHPTIAASMAAQGQTGPVPEWAGGVLITDPAVHEYRYGYFEVRARFRGVGAGMFPAVWLFATGGSTEPSGKGSAEIDIMEIFGHAAGNRWESTVHYRDNAGRPVRPEAQLPARTGDPSRWRTYAVDWQPNHIRFYDDGVLVGELTGSDASWHDTPMSLRLNYAMDAPWFPPPNRSGSGTPNEMFMDVDHVRIYTAKP